MTTKVYVEIPLSGDDLTDLDARELAIFIESLIDGTPPRVPGEYAGRKVENVVVYKNADDLKADLSERE